MWAAGLALAALMLFLCYLRDAQTFGSNSDAASVALQAWQMWHGNPILRGWWLSDECFYTVDLPLNALAEMAAGLRPGAIHVYAAVDYAVVVLLAGLLARGRARGREGIVAMLLTVGIMLAPSTVLGTRVLLQGPDHMGTQIAVLATFLVLDRAPQRWWVPLSVGILLTVAQVNDVQATFSAAAAVAAACGVRACAEVARWQRPPRERWYDTSLVVAAIASYGLAHLIVSGIHAAGGFYLAAPKYGFGFAPISAMPAQSWATIYCVLILFGADFIGQSMGISAIFALLHLVGVALGFGALWMGVRGFFTRMDRVNQTLVAGTVFILAAGAFGGYMSPVVGAHDIIPVLPFCAVLAGRLLGGRLTALRLEPVLAVGLAVMLAALGYNDIQPKAVPASNQLAVWLEAHHLTSGLAGYWESNIATVDSGGRVRLVSMVGGGTTAEEYESDATWYNPAISRANFVVSYSCSTDPSPVRPSVVRARYGTPAHVYHFGDYTIMVYGYNLLTRVTVPAEPRARYLWDESVAHATTPVVPWASSGYRPGGRSGRPRLFLWRLQYNKQVANSGTQPPRASRGAGSARRGRPREFDRDAAIDRALTEFWKHGYEATSISLLTEVMGITPPSLYAAFGDKRKLFREAVERYLGTHGAFMARALEQEPTARAATERILREAAMEFCGVGHPPGCLVVVAATNCGPASEEVRAELRARREAIMRAMQDKIAADVQARRLPRTTDARSLATYYAGIIQGMSALAVDGADHDTLLGFAQTAMLAWPA